LKAIRRLLGHDKPRELRADVFPLGYEQLCTNARHDAYRWYVGKYREHPRVPCVRVIIEPRSRIDMGAWTPNAWTIHIWEGQRQFNAALEHEFRHTLCIYNGKGESEEAVR
jgi:hypothetical protein